jgi:hypothetical protein
MIAKSIIKAKACMRAEAAKQETGRHVMVLSKTVPLVPVKLEFLRYGF